MARSAAPPSKRPRGATKKGKSLILVLKSLILVLNMTDFWLQ